MKINKQLIAQLFCAVLIFCLITACTPADSGKDGETLPNTAMSEGADDTSELYEFTVYANFEWFTVREWGADSASEYIAEKFNVNVTWEKPDTDPDTKLNLMAATGNYPEVIYMTRDADYEKLVADGHLLALDPYMYDGNDFEANTLESTVDLSRINGNVYMITNWSRREATGGNNAWMINKNAWAATGSPQLKTLEDIYDYLVAFKETDYLSHRGEEVFPLLTGESEDGSIILEIFNRSYGGSNPVANWYGVSTGELEFFLNDPIMLQALETANEWYNAGLFPASIFTDTREQALDKIDTGRGAILYYDFSQDQYNHFRKLFIEDTDGQNSYEVLVNPIFPAAEGVDFVYGDESSSLGGEGVVITKNAENPQRIFDMFSWMITKEGSINMMYGAPGGGMYDELDDDGNPILLKSEATFTLDELKAAGAWFWPWPAQADNVDRTKFAVNDAQPLYHQDFTTSLQANYFSSATIADLGEHVKSGQKYLTDEHTGIINSIEPSSELGVYRQAIDDKTKVMLPQIIMAENAEEFDTLVSELLTFAEDNALSQILEVYNQTREENIEMQGWSYYE